MENKIIVPSDKTLKKYGLNKKQWLEILHSQGDVCPICKNFPKTGKFVTDHFHAQGFSKMSDEKKRKYIRGITCWFCNHYYLGRGINVEKAENVVQYLKDFEKRKND